MEKLEYKDCYVFRRETAKRIKPGKRMNVEIGEGIVAVFGPTGHRNCGKEIKLAEVMFEKEFWDFEDAQDFWSNIQPRYLTKKYDYNRSIPLCYDIIELKNGDFVGLVANNIGEKDLLKNQVQMIREGIIPATGAPINNVLLDTYLEAYYSEQAEKMPEANRVLYALDEVDEILETHEVTKAEFLEFWTTLLVDIEEETFAEMVALRKTPPKILVVAMQLK